MFGIAKWKLLKQLMFISSAAPPCCPESFRGKKRGVNERWLEQPEWSVAARPALPFPKNPGIRAVDFVFFDVSSREVISTERVVETVNSGTNFFGLVPP